MIKDYVQLSRPKHWIKNVFVLMPAPFALADGAVLDPLRFGMGLLAFCLANSTVYSFNDAQDAERDRLHEEKRQRPVASGRVSERQAYLWSTTLLMLGTALAVGSGSTMALSIFVVYLASNLFYSLRAKDIPLLDVFLLSFFFLLRFLLGCALLNVDPSNWLLLCSYCLALFLALAKRRADILKGLDENHRPSLTGYSQSFLDQAMGITASMTIMSYAIYCIDSDLLVASREFISLPFVVFGVLEYLRKAHVEGAGGNTVDLLLNSPALLLVGVGWLGAVLLSVSI